MFIDEILKTQNNQGIDSIAYVLQKECSIFLKESNSQPLYKNLPIHYDNFQKIKVRTKKSNDLLSEVYNRAFDKVYRSLRQRAIFSSPKIENLTETISYEPFYIFPLNGYNFLYNSEVSNSDEYEELFNKLIQNLDESMAVDTISELMQLTYSSKTLLEGIESGSEILFYNIPYYYAVRVNYVKDYRNLLTT